MLIWVSSRRNANCDAAGAGEATGELECSVRTNGRVIVISVAPISAYPKIKVLDSTISFPMIRCFPVS